MEPLTLERAKQLAAEAVAERGEDYVYTNPFGAEANEVGIPCFYVHGNEPGCIAGMIMHRHGVTLEQLREVEQIAVDVPAFNYLKLSYGSPVSQYLTNLQGAQDHGRTWGEALAYANALPCANGRTVE